MGTFANGGLITDLEFDHPILKGMLVRKFFIWPSKYLEIQEVYLEIQEVLVLKYPN